MQLLLATIVVLATMADRPASADLPESLRPSPVHSWPEFLMTVGVIYAPAPWIRGEHNGREIDGKLRDQIGPRFTMEWRLADYLLLGGVFDIIGAGGSILFETGVRAGAIIPIDRDWCLYGLASGGGAVWVTEPPDHVSATRRGYIGWRAGISVGFRYRFSEWVGTYFELTGAANGFWSTTSIEGLEHYESPMLLRLQMVAGLSFDWSRAMRSRAKR